MRPEDFRKPVEQLTDRELVEQYDYLVKLQERRRAEAARDDATARRLLDSVRARQQLVDKRQPDHEPQWRRRWMA